MISIGFIVYNSEEFPSQVQEKMKRTNKTRNQCEVTALCHISPVMYAKDTNLFLI